MTLGMHLCSVCNRRTTNALNDDDDDDDYYGYAWASVELGSRGQSFVELMTFRVL